MTYAVIAFFIGILMGGFLWALVVARDSKIAHLKEDEVIIKRPMKDFILVQVTPEIARRLINFQGELVSPTSTEARALHPERTFRKTIVAASQVSQGDQKK